MKICYLSDLHNDFKSCLNLFDNLDECDVIVIAGDLNCGAHSTINDLISISTIVKDVKIVYVPGNHEFYGSSYKRVMEVFSSNKELLNSHGIYCLENNSMIIDDVNFIGVIGWPDDSYCKITVEKFPQYNDFHYISDFADDHVKLGKYNIKYLKKAIKKNIKNVIVTHWQPLTLCIDPVYIRDRYNPCFANDYTKIIDDMVDFGYTISAWIHGHSHSQCDMVYKGIPLLRNPVGYPHEGRRNFNINKFIYI